MDAKLRYVEIKKLFGQYDVEWNIDRDTTVLVGQNGSGKTTILNILLSSLLNDENNSYFEKSKEVFDSVYLKFINNGELRIVHEGFNNAGVTVGAFREFAIEQLSIARENNDQKQIETAEKIIHELFYGLQPNTLIRLQPKRLVQAENLNLEGIFTEFISTLNMSANAINTVTASDGKSLNILDIEINQAIISFQKLKEQESYFEIKAKVVSVLNDFFSTTQKNIELTDTDFVIKNLKQEPLKLSQLSAGERQIIYIVFKVAVAYFNESLVLMDEPEISLHLEWQEKLLRNLREINDKSQMIVVTHSPAIIMDGWMDSYVDIQTILKPIKDDE